nr:hypothetical protein [Priestia megaterium]WEZ56243.1 hypothetical protein P5632_00055 [Priestia megaterium]
MKMGNCKKQNRKRQELDINELFKRITFETKQSQRTFKEIENLLNRSQQLMRKLLTNSNNILTSENAFFNVAGAPCCPCCSSNSSNSNSSATNYTNPTNVDHQSPLDST